VNADDFIEFAKLVGKLKETKRTGWVRDVKIENCESVGDHIFRAALLGMILADEAGLDGGRVAKMMLVHDLDEIITGDIIRGEKEKEDSVVVRERELSAFKNVISSLPEDLQKEYLKLWNEYQDEKTPEAKLCRSVDRIDMAIQAQEYFSKFPDRKILKCFSDTNDLNKVSPQTKEIIKKLLKWGKSDE